MIVRPAPIDHLPWLAERAGLVLSPRLGAIEAIGADGRIHGMVGFDGFTVSSCMVHVALDNPAALRCLKNVAFRTMFLPTSENGLGLSVARAVVRGDNERSMHLVSHLGFRLAYRSVDGWDRGVDLVLYEMRPGECRHLGGA